MGGGEVTRLEKLEAVAEAALEFADKSHKPIDHREWEQIKRRFYDALATLDAHTEAPQETVTLAVWRSEDDETQLVKPGSDFDEPYPGWTRLGTVTLPLDREGGR